MNKKQVEGNANGIDRIDSSLGYTHNNTVPCCSVCNLMKSRFSFKEFKSHILKIAEHFNNWIVLPQEDGEVMDDKEN